MTDDQARNVQQYEYDSFGNQHDMKNRIKQPYGYTGREHDRETGLRYYRARYYDGEVGRFISEDPIGFAGGDVNLYNYVLNRPTRYGDAYGLWFDEFVNNMLGDKPGDIFTAGGASSLWFIPGAQLIPAGIGFSFDRVVMPNGESDWFFTAGGGLMIPGISAGADRGITRKYDVANNCPSTNFTKDDIEGFTVSLNVDAAVGAGAGVEGTIAPHVVSEVGGYLNPTPMVSIKGGPRIGSLGANLFGNYTWDIGQ